MTDNPGGRPPKLLPDDKTLKAITGLALIGCTKKEAAAALFVSEPTFHKFLKDHPEAREAFEMGEGQLAVSLRRNQHALAKKNATMAIWLGKQHLGQKDKIEHTGAGGGPIQTIDLSGATDDDLDRLERLLGPVFGRGDGTDALGSAPGREDEA